MTLKSSLFFAKSLIFPKTGKKTSARKSLVGALVCIALSIVPLVVVLSVTNGMINGMTERLIGLSSNHIQAYVATGIKETSSAKNFYDYADKLCEHEEITQAWPEISLSALAAGKNIRTGIQIRAIPPEIFTQNESFSSLFKVIDGSYDEFLNSQSEQNQNQKIALVGQKTAEILNLKAGDSFRVITTRKNGSKVSPRLTSFKVGAIISSGYQELDKLWVFIPLETAYSFINTRSADFTIMLKTKYEPSSVNIVRVQYELQEQNGRIANFYRWDEVNSSEFENFSSTKVMLVCIMLMIVLVASINISSAVVMLVMERQNEIAILKSIGGSPKGITLSFLIAGTSCGLGGVILGLPLGILLSVFSNQLVFAIEWIVNVFAKFTQVLKGVSVNEISYITLMDPSYYLSEIPIDIPWSQIILICIFTIILSMIVSFIPAHKAGKEKPLDILRKN